MKTTILSLGVCVALAILSRAEDRIWTPSDGQTAELKASSSMTDANAREKKMLWPQPKLSKVERFKSKFDHGANGIPFVVACELQGKVLAQTQTLAKLKTLIQ